MPLHDPLFPEDHHDIVGALEQRRPTLNALELDGLKRRVLRKSGMTITNNSKAILMRSRTAITAMLASGLLLSGGGTALGISALQSTTNAGVAQYGTTGSGTVPTLGGAVPPPAAVTPPAAAVPPPAAVTPPAAAVTPPAAAVTPPADEGQVASETSGSPAPEKSAPAGAKVSAVSPARTNPVQAARQVATVSGDSLPFTGYASIPVLLLGAALFATGLVLRRRSAQL